MLVPTRRRGRRLTTQTERSPTNIFTPLLI
jgi:hypothetical protein